MAKSELNSLKHILNSLRWVVILVPMGLAFVFKHPVLIWVLFSIPGIYMLAYAVIFKEHETKYGNYKGVSAIVAATGMFFFFFGLGLPAFLVYLGFPNYYKTWPHIIIWLGLPILSIILADYLAKRNKKSITKIDTWIQTSDFDVKDGNSLSLIEAKEFIKSFNWEKEYLKKNELDLKNKETCSPGIGFNHIDRVFHVTSEKKNVYEIFATIPNAKKNFFVKLFVDKSDKSITNLKLNEVQLLLEYFYRQEYDKILSYVK